MMTDVGKKRKIDEDSILAAELLFGVDAEQNAFKLLVVADGLGGHLHGDVASKMALNSIAHTVVPHLLDKTSFTRLLGEGIRNAHNMILDCANKHPELSGMCTTVVCALVMNNNVYMANIGDSRAYVISPDEIRRVTRTIRLYKC